ncbi:MAG: aminoacyl-tRNA hydrolase, partial [Pirellulales bacterium]
MKLIVGLGNPGRKYERTRHNVGFAVVAELQASFGGGKIGAGRSRRAFQGEVFDTEINRRHGPHAGSAERVLLLCPHTLMNASGRSVREAVDFYRIGL